MKKIDATETMEKTAQMPAMAMKVETMVMSEQMLLKVPLVKMELTEMMLTEPLVKMELTEVMMMTEQIMKKMDATETMEKTAQMLAPAMMVETMVMTEQVMLSRFQSVWFPRSSR